MKILILGVIMILIVVTGPFIQAQLIECDPPTSVQDLQMKTMDNKKCFFPFNYNNTTYMDCAGDDKRWCATTCNFNRDRQFSLCRWERKNLQVSSCQNLSDSRQYAEPDTASGARCVFPFVYQNKCYNDCTNEGSGYIWCGTMNSVDLNKDDFIRCEYSRNILDKPECENLTEIQKYKYPDTTSGLQCVFPFVFNYVCHNDCILDIKNTWCATAKVYNTTNWTGCKFLINMKQYETFLKHGLYKIYADCSYNIFCGGSVVSSSNDNNSLVFLAKNNTDFAINYWEVIPQPQSSVIIRVPLLQSLSTKNQPAWSFSTSSLLILKHMVEYSENTRFVINNNMKRNNSFMLSKIIGTSITKSSNVGFQAAINDTRSFVYMTEIPIEQYWRFELIKEFTKDDFKDSGNFIPVTSTNIPSKTTTMSTISNANLVQRINNLQIIVLVTLGLVVTVLVVAVVTIVCVMRT